MTARVYFEMWLSQQKYILRPSTYEALEVYFGVHIIPFFQDYELEDIKAIHIQEYVNQKLSPCGRADGSGPLSLVSVRKHLSLLRQSLNNAVVLDLIPINPALAVKLSKNKQKIRREVFMNINQANKMLEAMKGTYIYPIVAITLMYGLRRSEVLGLKWSAIDFDNNTISIEHTVVKNRKIHYEDSVKSESSYRVYQLLPEIKQLLLSLSRNGEYIFSWPDGTVYRPDSVTRMFKRAVQKCGFPKMRFHDLRHSTASILFDMGWSLEDVKNWLGHADIETTSNIYLHYSNDRRKLLGDQLQGVFKL